MTDNKNLRKKKQAARNKVKAVEESLTREGNYLKSPYADWNKNDLSADPPTAIDMTDDKGQKLKIWMPLYKYVYEKDGIKQRDVLILEFPREEGNEAFSEYGVRE